MATWVTHLMIDRIKKLKVLDEKFHIPYSSRFEEGEFRKRIQFMYGGKLQKIKFMYSGTDIDAVLDRLPTAQILSEEKGVYTVSAETFGKGVLDLCIKGILPSAKCSHTDLRMLFMADLLGFRQIFKIV